MARSYLAKLLLFIVCLVAAVQFASYLATRKATRDAILGRVHQELTVAAEVLEELLRGRATRLMNTVTVLAGDFAFKKAAATGDAPTVLSALVNHSKRVQADVAMVVNLQGQTIARTRPSSIAPRPFAFSKLLKEAQKNGRAVATVVLNGRPYQMAVTPVNAPLPIAWVSMGFRLNPALASEIRELTGLQVSFASAGDGGYGYAATTLDTQTRDNLLTALNTGDLSTTGVARVDLGGSVYLALMRRLASYGGDIAVILQKPRKQILAPFYELNRRFLWITLVSLLLASLVAIVLVRRVARPVKQLASAARRIGRGEYEATVEVANKDELGELAHAFNAMQSAIAEREARILHQAYHDKLTGLPNRELAQDRLGQAIARARREVGQVSVLMLDLDRFKEINDSFGREVGDRALQEVATRLRGCLRESDTVARLSADEFLVLLESANVEQGCTIAVKLLASLAETIAIGELAMNLDAAVGLSEYPDHGEQAEQLLRRADIALTDAKAQNRRIAIYQSGRDEQHLRRIKLLRDLRVAIEHGELQLMYQPKVAMADRRPVGVEALVRWEHPELGPLQPGEFISVAEQAGTVTHLTHWILERAIAQCSEWRRRGLDLAASVNLSPVDLLDQGLPERLNELLSRHRMPAHKVCLELTEGTVMRDTRNGLELLNKFKAQGVRLSIDDFGTGYSSLAQLKRLPVDELKIDRSFIAELTDGSDAAAIVRSIIEIGHQLGLEVTAEGIESETCWHLLKKYRCDTAQGFYLSRALPADEIPYWINQHDAGHTRKQA
ncbi:MAG: EAL domain-containing protein [Nitrococcus sp.]|nr:EAL domain-containing protein [Nitrococcus sp.]